MNLHLYIRKNSRRLGLDLDAVHPQAYLGRLGLFQLPIDATAAFSERFPDIDFKQDDLRAVIATVSEHVGAPTEAEEA